MAIPAPQMMRPTPYHIPPRFHHAINRPPYGYNHHFTPTTHPTFLSATSQMLTPNVTLGTCALPITTGNCHVPSNSTNPVLSHPHAVNGLHIHPSVLPQGIAEPERRPSSSCSSTTSPISSSPGPLGCPPEDSLSEPTSMQPLKQCSYSLMNGTLGGGVGGMGPPLASCAHGTPFLPTHPHPGGTTMVSTPGCAVYATASAIPSQEYAPNGINVNLPTVAGTACLPTTAVPLWNPYPSLPVPNGMMTPLPPSIPKLSYDTPRYKLTPERAIPLIKWFEEHKDHPYPSRHEKMLLCQSTQLTFTQVSTWFANARRRMKKANCENADDDKAMSSDEGSQKDASSPVPLRDGHDD